MALTGWLLISGFVLGIAAAMTPSLGVVWVAELPEQLHLISTRRRAWITANTLFAASLWVSALGLAGLAVLLYEEAGSVTPWLGLVSIVIGTVLWLVHLAMRVSVTQLLARSMGPDGDMPAWYEPVAWWGLVLLVGYFVLANVGIGILAIVVLDTGLLAAWSAWTALSLVVLFLVTLVAFRNTLPVLPQFPALVLGIAALVG